MFRQRPNLLIVVKCSFLDFLFCRVLTCNRYKLERGSNIEGDCELSVLPHLWSGSCKFFLQISTIDFNWRDNFSCWNKNCWTSHLLLFILHFYLYMITDRNQEWGFCFCFSVTWLIIDDLNWLLTVLGFVCLVQIRSG